MEDKIICPRCQTELDEIKQCPVCGVRAEHVKKYYLKTKRNQRIYGPPEVFGIKKNKLKG